MFYLLCFPYAFKVSKLRIIISKTNLYLAFITLIGVAFHNTIKQLKRTRTQCQRYFPHKRNNRNEFFTLIVAILRLMFPVAINAHKESQYVCAYEYDKI